MPQSFPIMWEKIFLWMKGGELASFYIPDGQYIEEWLYMIGIKMYINSRISQMEAVIENILRLDYNCIWRWWSLCWRCSGRYQGIWKWKHELFIRMVVCVLLIFVIFCICWNWCGLNWDKGHDTRMKLSNVRDIHIKINLYRHFRGLKYRVFSVRWYINKGDDWIRWYALNYVYNRCCHCIWISKVFWPNTASIYFLFILLLFLLCACAVGLHSGAHAQCLLDSLRMGAALESDCEYTWLRIELLGCQCLLAPVQWMLKGFLMMWTVWREGIWFCLDITSEIYTGYKSVGKGKRNIWGTLDVCIKYMENGNCTLKDVNIQKYLY